MRLNFTLCFNCDKLSEEVLKIIVGTGDSVKNIKSVLSDCRHCNESASRVMVILEVPERLNNE